MVRYGQRTFRNKRHHPRKMDKIMTKRLIALDTLAQIYQTDKREHGYLPHYEKYLPDKCRWLLEIGVAHGQSLHLWNDLYGTDCEISAIDLFEDPEHKSPRWCRRNEYIPYIEDQSDTNFLYTLRTKFEVIIDDGSHNADHQWISFKHLFLNNLRSGGLYVTEDLHCNKEPFYCQSIKRFEDTMLYVFKNYEKNKIPVSDMFTAQEAED